MTNQKFMTLLLSAAMGAAGVFAQSSAQPTFSSPRDACHRLFEAVNSGDVQAIAKILGGSMELASSHDDAQDKIERQQFVEKYQQMHRMASGPDGSMMLYIGAENWPFPIPLVQNNGVWRFDPEAGAKEVLYRRIGRNEFNAIELCHQFVSSRKQDPAHAQSSSQASELASVSAGADPVPSRGYYFVELGGRRPGQFVLIAYPAAYRSSGVMTFVVTEKNVVYQKDLGADSSSAARAMRAFKKDASWENAESGK